MAGHNNVFNTSEIARSTTQSKNSKPTTTCYPSADYPIGFTFCDYNFATDVRIKSYFDNVKYNETNQAFDAAIHLDALDDTIMYNKGCTWLDNFKHDRDFQHGKLTLKPDQLKKGVSFPTEFASAPAVVVWLSGFDVSRSGGEWRFSVSATDITTKGFEMLGSVFGTTKLNSLEATWIAYPASRPNIDSGSFDTLEVRPNIYEDRWEHWKNIQFRKDFQRQPRVFFALSKIDSWHKEQDNKFLRLKCYITDATTKGMTAHLDQWTQLNMYSAQGQWLAVQDD